MSRSTDDLAALYDDVRRETRRLEVIHEERLRCGRGCSSCCVDGLTVYDVEADNIRRNHAELLERDAPGPEGACAFLDSDGACRIYESRPYVCRTQGLPLRWLEEVDDETVVEMRDVCPLNDEGVPVEELEEEDCWTIGPAEERLARLQIAHHGNLRRVTLRDMFARSGGDSDLA
jgi:Fe-S-cluster containining protein